MELTYEELERSLIKIFTAQDIIKVKKGSKDVFVLFKQPDNITKLRAHLVYDKSYSDALDKGLLPIEKLESLIKDRNIFTDKDQKDIDDIESKLEAQRVLLSKTTKVKANADRIKKIIEDLEFRSNTIKYKRLSKLTMSAESKAEEDRQLFLCSRCSYDVNNNLFWSSMETILSEKDLAFKDSVLRSFSNFYHGIDLKTIRYIARCNLWRIRYVNSLKTSEPLFGIPTVDYSSDQFNLVYWSNYYQSIYEMMPEDRPSDMIIEDDEALDSYMTSYYEERNREDAARKSKRETKGRMSAFDKEEVIVTRSNELYEDIKYDKPREAQRIKDKTDIKKKARRKR